jgi:hypothetical protein
LDSSGDLMTISDVEHPFIYSLPIHMSSLEKCLLRSLADFLNWVTYEGFLFCFVLAVELYELMIYFG